MSPTLIKKKIKFSSHIRKFRLEQLQSHVWLTASSYWGNICAFPHRSPSSYMTLQLLHPEFPYIWGKFDFLFISAQCVTVLINSSPNCVPLFYSRTETFVYGLMKKSGSGKLRQICLRSLVFLIWFNFIFGLCNILDSKFWITWCSSFRKMNFVLKYVGLYFLANIALLFKRYSF
jgi:hypothetical protein